MSLTIRLVDQVEVDGLDYIPERAFIVQMQVEGRDARCVVPIPEDELLRDFEPFRALREAMPAIEETLAGLVGGQR